MRNPFRSVFRWLRRPVVSRSPLPFEQALAEPYEPATVDILLNKLEQGRREHLEWADRLDRKLLAVITADGVYAAILASIRDSIPAAVVATVGSIVAASFILAYLAWRPHPYGAVSVVEFVPSMGIYAGDLNRILIAAHARVNEDTGRINRWKAEKLTWAVGFFAAAALVTLLVYTAAV